MSGSRLCWVCMLVFCIVEVAVGSRGALFGSGWSVSWLDILLVVVVFILMCDLFGLVIVQAHVLRPHSDRSVCSFGMFRFWHIPIIVLGKPYHVGIS